MAPEQSDPYRVDFVYTDDDGNVVTNPYYGGKHRGETPSTPTPTPTPEPEPEPVPYP